MVFLLPALGCDSTINSIIINCPHDAKGFVSVFDDDPKGSYATGIIWSGWIVGGVSKEFTANDLGSRNQVWLIVDDSNSWTVNVNGNDYTLKGFDAYKITSSGVDDEGQILHPQTQTATQATTQQTLPTQTETQAETQETIPAQTEMQQIAPPAQPTARSVT